MVTSSGANVPFFIIFLKNLTFQRRPKARVWSKGLISFGQKNDAFFKKKKICIHSSFSPYKSNFEKIYTLLVNIFAILLSFLIQIEIS